MKARENEREAVNAEGMIDTREPKEKSMPDDFCQYCEYRNTCRK
jgi:hypothetical protein